MDANVTKVKPPVRREPSAAQALVTHVFHLPYPPEQVVFFFFFFLNFVMLPR
jgi:hypothetical protein